jgi:hypothetical protein
MSYTGTHLFWAGLAGFLLGLSCTAKADVSIVRYTDKSYQSTYDAVYNATRAAHHDAQHSPGSQSNHDVIGDRVPTMEF